MVKSALTFDVDWAPDWVVDDCYKLCKELEVPATFFITHESDVLDDLRADPQIELGIHPNLMPGTTHGKNECAVFEHCIEIVPEAKAVRTHGLYQATNLFAFIADNFTMIETDVSLYLPGHKGLHPFDFHCGRSRRRITRLPFYFEDDLDSMRPNVNWECTPPSEGLRIFDFHPVHVMLNMSTLDDYNVLKCSLGKRGLHNALPKDFEPFVNQRECGARTFLNHVVNDIGAKQFSTISEITQKYRKSSED